MMVTFLYLMLPPALTVSVVSSLNSLESVKEDPLMADVGIPDIDKRESSGADPWSLCPNNMERVDCFFEYLRVYARLRKATSGSNSFSVKTIGKRARLAAAADSDVCLEDHSSSLCLLRNIMNDVFRDDRENRRQVEEASAYR
ncbi:hypothetical protein BsWGS_08227 [Bradybaena similaris]